MRLLTGGALEVEAGSVVPSLVGQFQDWRLGRVELRVAVDALDRVQNAEWQRGSLRAAAATERDGLIERAGNRLAIQRDRHWFGE